MTSSPSSPPDLTEKHEAATRGLRAFARSILAQAIARAFTPPPDVPVWEWADKTVYLSNEDAAEPGYYRSTKTVWTRRLQDLARRPAMLVWDYDRQRWTPVRVSEINIQKSTQSGFTEAILNVIRWHVSFATRNVIYLIDSLDQAKKIARRLLRSLKLLDPTIFTGDPDDIKTSEFLLRGMEIIFGGSFSPGATANKQAPIVVADEIEDHGQALGDTSATRNLSYRKKTAAGGLQFNLSKPKLEGGPINRLWKRGNREEFHIECPHCRHLQFITARVEEWESPFSEQFDWVNTETGDVSPIAPELEQRHLFAYLPRPLPRGETRKVRTGRLVSDHCKDLLGGWDELKVLRDTYYECAACKGRIEEHQKAALALAAAERDALCGWLPTAIGTPEIVSQRMSDLLSTNEASSWGRIQLEIINAAAEGRTELQGVMNNVLARTWREELSKTEEGDIRANVAGRELYFIDEPTEQGHRRNVFDDRGIAETALATMLARGIANAEIHKSFCPPYKRGTIPFVPSAIILGSDVGGNYARGVVIAAMENMIDCAVIDWVDEIDPEAIGEMVLKKTYPCHADGKQHRIGHGFIDAKFRKTEVLRVCWAVHQARGHLIPVAGLGGTAARSVRVWSYTPVNSYAFKGKGLKQLVYNDREAKNDLYISCLSKKTRRVFFPVDLFDREGKPTDPRFVRELCAEELKEDKNGQKYWNPFPGPNHDGDALKNAVTGLRFLTRKHHNVRE